jgi:acetoin utilization protein AcuB
MLVREMMTVNPATIDPSATLRDAAAIMKSEGQSRLVVCDGDEIVGILVDSDVLRANDLNARVRDVMSTDFHKVYADATIREAGNLMVDYDVGGLPVISREGRLVGLLTARDIVRGYLREEKTRISVESGAIYLAMTRSREYEHYWLDRLHGFGYKAAITQVGTSSELLALKLRESMIAAAVARGVVLEVPREKIALSNAVRDAYSQLAISNPGLGGGFKLAAVRGEGRISVAIFGRFGHALVDGPEQLAVGYSVI